MEEESINNVVGEIHIQITDENVLWNSEMSFQDVYFWLEATQQIMMKTFLENNEEEYTEQ